MTSTRRQATGVPPVGGFVAVIGIAFVVLAGVTIRFIWQDKPLPVDLWWHDAMAAHRNGVADTIARFLNTAGGTLSMTLVTAVVVVLLLVARQRRQALIVAVTVALASGLCTGLKVAIARPRPLDGIVDFGTDSFPSGHTTTAAALAIAIALAFPRVWSWALAGVWVAGMALSRTYLLVHWSSDVIAGAVLGASVAVLMAAVLGKALASQSRLHGSLRKPSLADRSFLGNEQVTTETLSS